MPVRILRVNIIYGTTIPIQQAYTYYGFHPWVSVVDSPFYEFGHIHWSWWDGSLQAVSSGSILFAQVSVFVCWAEKFKCILICQEQI